MPRFKRGRDWGRGIARKSRRLGGTGSAPRYIGPAPAYSKSVMRTRLNKRIGGYLGIEKKFYDTSLSAAALLASTAGGEHNPSATIALNTVVQGDGESNRDGRQIAMDSITIHGIVHVASAINQTVVDASTYAYIALVQDQQTNGAILTSEEVFENPSAVAGLSPMSFRNLQFIQRFKVLVWKRINLQQQQVSYDGTNLEKGGFVKPFTLHANLHGIKVNYTASTETIANIADNSLNIVAFVGAVATTPLLSYNSRLRFYG